MRRSRKNSRFSQFHERHLRLDLVTKRYRLRISSRRVRCSRSRARFFVCKICRVFSLQIQNPGIRNKCTSGIQIRANAVPSQRQLAQRLTKLHLVNPEVALVNAFKGRLSCSRNGDGNVLSFIHARIFVSSWTALSPAQYPRALKSIFKQ